jgi:hypothetical protein
MDQQNPRRRQVETGLSRHVNLYPFCCRQPAALAHQLRKLGTNRRNGNRWPIPQPGEINTPRPMDAAEARALYDGFMAGILAWINRVSEC